MLGHLAGAVLRRPHVAASSLPKTTAATAILDRLLHHADVVVVSGYSIRLREAQEHRERHKRNDPVKSAAV